MSCASYVVNNNSQAPTTQVNREYFQIGRGDIFYIKAFGQQWTFKEKERKGKQVEYTTRNK